MAEGNNSDPEGMTTEEKLDKLLKNTNDVLTMKTDLIELTQSVKTLTDDITKLRRNTDSIPKIETTLKNLQSSISSLTTETTTNSLTIKENQVRIKSLEEENVMLKTELENLKSQTRRSINDENSNLENLIETQVRRQYDKNSLLFDGVTENHNENLITLLKQLSFDTGLEINDKDIAETFRLGKYNHKDKRPRTIKATFTTKSTRNHIYSNRGSIKQNPACRNVWINECLDDDQKRVRSEVRAVADLAKSQGKEARAVGDTVIISGIKYHHQTFSTLPPGITLEKAFTREHNNKIYFNSEHSPLSSFYPSDIEYQNSKYIHNEQGFQHQKAVTMGNLDLANKIKNEISPRKCKSLGKLLGNSKVWDDKRDSIMEDLVYIKAQNPTIKEKLLKTGDKDLIESTADNYWACGASFRSQKVQNDTTTGKNKLGQIWVKTRSDIRNAANPNDNINGDMPPLEDS